METMKVLNAARNELNLNEVEKVTGGRMTDCTDMKYKVLEMEETCTSPYCNANCHSHICEKVRHEEVDHWVCT